MATEERPDGQDDATSVTSKGPPELVPVDVGESKPRTAGRIVAGPPVWLRWRCAGGTTANSAERFLAAQGDQASNPVESPCLGRRWLEGRFPRGVAMAVLASLQMSDSRRISI